MFAMAKYDYPTKVLLPNDHPLGGKDYLAFARRLRQIGLDNGIECNQSHAPFPTYSLDVRSYMKRAIECTAEAGGKICVIHPSNIDTAEKNAEMFFELLPFAKECGVRIATENMWDWKDGEDHACFSACATPEDFNAHLDAVNDPYLVACLDLGHAEMRGIGTTAVEMIHALGDRLAALHVHDNDLRNDSHQLPFTMQMDFEAIIKALREVGYKGDMTLEADCYLRGRTPDNVFEGIKIMADTAMKLKNMFLA
jgi:sugar phosphate isomerase/epimerase